MKKYFVSLLFLAFSLITKAQTIKLISSNETDKWKAEKDLKFTAKNEDQSQIIIYPNKQLQKIDGFGGCFNELGWEALSALSPEIRNSIIHNLFSKEEANFNICRTPIAASDYALSWYSYNDVFEDFTMRNFNIDRDRYILIPYIKSALSVKPNLTLWGSPWSPPAWMKVNNHYTLTSGAVKGGKERGNEMGDSKNIANNATAFKMQHSYLEAYALYFSKYVKAYQKEGVNISSIQVQNEIAYAPQWPSCTWRPEDLAYFIKKYLAPKFKEDDVKSEIWLGTVNYGNPDYVRYFLKDTTISKYIDGVGFQWGGKKAIGTIHKEYPNVKLMQTESECGEGENNWKSAEYTWSLIKHYFNNGANSYLYWNMVLDHAGKSSWGWPQNMLISINKETKNVVYNPEFYLMKHLSHFVVPDAHLLATNGGKDHLAFQNPDGSIVLILANLENDTQTINVEVNGKMMNAVLKPKSFNTLTWKP
ncbi:O-Glycosyl hydrolase family 30 [Arcticibacter svalbardensis MN12-7]|uniref:O-Glycosyl hydrolase family 30 n=1 Tax=Arcticibacter svalbardensis MN12-7 TaxID=1150600 RepID=R9H249_9SPHI|nr:glycoside hydrolase family 30 protein [Arcticibacter svalbardensis]EOR95279.1 O-Glycosyl hydrolase family 30 [Arcticibacter svalbardensis MN12-7]